MSQRESPEPEVGGSVGDGSQTVLNGVDGLMDEYLPKLKLVAMTTVFWLIPTFPF